MAPKAPSKLASAPEPVLSDDDEPSDVTVRSPSPAIQTIDWTPNKLFGLFVTDVGTLDTIDSEGRSSKVFSLIAYNCV